MRNSFHGDAIGGFSVPAKYAASWEPVLKVYDAADLSQARLVGRAPTPDEVDTIKRQINNVFMLGQSYQDFKAALSGVRDYKSYLFDKSRQFKAIVEKWNDILGASDSTMRTEIYNEGGDPSRLYTWTSTPEAKDVRTAITSFNDIFETSYKKVTDHYKEWENFWHAAQIVAALAAAPLAIGLAAGAAYLAYNMFSQSNTGTTVGLRAHLTPWDASPSVPNLISQAMLMDGMPRRTIKLKRQRAEQVANRTARIFKLRNLRYKRQGVPKYQEVSSGPIKMNFGCGIPTGAVAGFGDVEINYGFDHDPETEENLRARLLDYAMFDEFYDIEPGSLEATMLADYFDLEAYKDPKTHYFLKKLLKGAGKLLKKVARVALPVVGAFLPGIGGAVASLFAGGGGGAVPQTIGRNESLAQTNAGEQLPPPQPAASPGILDTLINIAKEWVQGKVTTAAKPGAVTRFGRPLGVFSLVNGQYVTIPVQTDPTQRAKAEALLNTYLSDPTVQAGAFRYAFSRNVEFTEFDAIGSIASSRDDQLYDHLSDEPAHRMMGNGRLEVDCGHLFDRRTGVAPDGVFYSSSLISARLTDLPSGVYGQIRVGEMPFRIDINRNKVDSRAKVSFVHEMMHAVTELLKLGLSHEQLHALSVLITTEVLPGYLALDNKLRR